MTTTTDGATRHLTTLADEGPTVLLVSTSEDAVRLSGPIARWSGARLITVSDLQTACGAITACPPHSVVSALPLTDELGLTLLLWMAVHHPEVPVVVVADDLTDDLAQQARFFGATAALARTDDVEQLSADVAGFLGLSPAIDIWEHIAAVAGQRRLRLVTNALDMSLCESSPLAATFDADRLLPGLFRGLGQIRGLHGSVALAADGSLLGVADLAPSLDVPETLSTLAALIEESHAACDGAGLAELETAVFRTDRETLVASCCAAPEAHAHVITIVAKDGNRALVELAHRRLRRELKQGVGAPTMAGQRVGSGVSA